MKQDNGKRVIGYALGFALSFLLTLVFCWVGYEIIREYNEWPSALFFFGLGLVAAIGIFFFGNRLKKAAK